MRYRLTCLTPLLAGDGQRLSPIDYMVWKDHVNVLDQRRIFRLLSKGPRLDSYLTQIQRAEKLDFASWGGFAQNFAGRRIPFEFPGYAAFWERARAESLHIPTFAAGCSGQYLPASTVKGALRTGLVWSRWSEQGVQAVLDPVAARLQEDRPARRPAALPEDLAVGAMGSSRLRIVAAGDSQPVPHSAFKIYLLRTATLEGRGAGPLQLAWKQIPRGSVGRPDDSTPIFAEMASPGTVFEGRWSENAFLARSEVMRALRWKPPAGRAQLFAAVNGWAEQLLASQKNYAHRAGLPLLAKSVDQVSARLEEARAGGAACLLSLGWGGGLLTKSAWSDTNSDSYRRILRSVPLYARAVESSLPFPKTRKIVFEQNQPAAAPGWALLEVL